MHRTRQEIDAHAAWRQRRHQELAGPDSWLGLTGLYWLEEGENRVGAGTDAAVHLPDGPDFLGVLLVRSNAAFWSRPGEPERALRSDRDGDPEVIDCGSARFFIIERHGRLGVRVRDRAWAERAPFAGVACFPYDPAWSVEADWVDLPVPLTLEVPDVGGELKTVVVRARAEFFVGDERLSLLPMSVGDDGVFFVFRDRSSGRETYGAGRFLKANPAVDGKMRLDFNRAFNPPCAFTPFATCPLPPPENWLPVAIPAGERKWEKDRC